MSTTATATPTLSVDGTETDSRERDVSANSTTEFTFDHTFDEPGSYTLTVNGREVGSGPVTVVESTPTEPSTDASGSGFGVGAALVGITGLSYFLLNQGDS